MSCTYAADNLRSKDAPSDERCSAARGLGSFVFSNDAATIRVFSFRPKSSGRAARIVIAMHGLDRAASKFRDVLVKQAERTGQIVLVPEFDAAQFPDVYAYNYGKCHASAA
jgi:hypothetical protein